MTKDESLGTFEAILKGRPPQIRAVAVALRGLIRELHPEAFETPRNGERCTTYGVGPRKMTQAYAHIMPLKDSVNLGLYHGAVLPDPKGLLSGTGKGSRHAKLRSLQDVSAPAIRALLRAALAERKRMPRT
jgi:Domain of unknown function (DU1801)